MKIKLLAMMAAIAFAGAGCVNLVVPKTVIKGSIAGKPFSLTSPKDSELTGLQITANTNGEVTITIERLAAKMNPAVISMTGDAQVSIINAVGEQVQAAMASGMKAAAK
jgi:hypothetical protein